MSFVEDGIGLEEIDLVPTNHPEERSCQNLGAAQGCKEVPVSITDDLQTVHLSISIVFIFVFSFVF